MKIFNHEGKPLIVEYTRHHPPNVAACIRWLRNRQPLLWGNRPQPPVPEGPLAHPGTVTDAELERIIDMPIS